MNINIIKYFNSIKKINEKWDIYFNFLINYFKKNENTIFIVNILKNIHNNKLLCFFIFLGLSWLCSNLLLCFIYYFMLVDSLILSLLILQNNLINKNSRRLCKNIILIFLTKMNIIGNMIILFLIMFIYMEYSKFINRIIFKFIKFILKLIGNAIPIIYLLYPDMGLFNFDDPDMTLNTDKYKDSYYKTSKANKQKNLKNNLNFLKKNKYNEFIKKKS